MDEPIHHYRVLDAMQRYGGDFVKRLGVAGMYADSQNLQRIKEAFPDYWKHYTSLAIQDAESKKSQEAEVGDV